MKAELKVHSCVEFGFVISEFIKKPRLSELAIFREDLYTPFHFRSKLVSLKDY